MSGTGASKHSVPREDKSDGLQLPWPFFALLVACIFRLPIFFISGVIHNDSYEYIRAATSMLQGDWTGGVAPPVYSFLIMVVNSFVGNYELSGVMVSWIFGVLVVIPVYFLTKRVFDERVGRFSSLLAAVQPTLYFYSGSVLSDSTYYFFLVLSAYVGWLAFEKGRFVLVALFSLSTTIAYLIRPEAIGFIFIFSVWALFVNPPHEKRPLFRRIVLAGMAAVCFIIFSSPYLIALRQEFGRWEISRKASISLVAPDENTGKDATSEQSTRPGSISAAKKKKISLSLFVNEPLEMFKRLSTGFVQVLFKYQQALNPILFLLAIIGLIRRREDKTLWRIDLYLLSYCFFFFVLVLPFFWITKRHTSHLVLVALPWAAYGIVRVASFVRMKAKIGFLRDHGATLFLILVMAILFTEGFVDRVNSRKHRMIRKEAGVWMRENLPKGPVISRLPHEAFYGDMDWVNVQDYSYDNLLRKANDKNARYLVVDEDVAASKNDFVHILKEQSFDLVYVKQKKDQKIFVFSFRLHREEQSKK
jgi:4-amino-4-deoxy-L-arabinose transferase-like glycosyltransferase